MTARSQCTEIADHLRKGFPLTAMDALRLFSCARAAARIEDLRKQGMAITTNMISVIGKNGVCRVAQYTLTRGEP